MDNEGCFGALVITDMSKEMCYNRSRKKRTIFQDRKVKKMLAKLKGNKKAKKICLILAAFCTIVAIAGIVRIVKYEKEKKQNAKEQVISLCAQAMELLEQGDRQGAISLAYDAVTKYERTDKAQTEIGMKTLATCLGVYDGSGVLQAIDQMQADGILSNMKVSPSEERLLVGDNCGNLYVINLLSKTVVFRVSQNEIITRYGFIDEDSFYYLAETKELKKVVMSEQKAYCYDKKTQSDEVLDVVLSKDGKVLLARKQGAYEFIDATTMEKKTTYACEEIQDQRSVFDYMPSDFFYVLVHEEGTDYLTALRADSGEIAFRITKPEGVLQDIAQSEEVTYVLTKKEGSGEKGKSIITAIKRSNGEVQFVHEYDDISCEEVEYSFGGQGENLLLISANEALMANAQHGQELTRYDIGERIIRCEPSSDGGFCAYTENGICHVLSAAGDYMDMRFDYLACNTLSEYIKTKNISMGLRKDSNHILFFAALQNEAATVYEDEVKQALKSSCRQEEAKEMIEKNEMVGFDNVFSYLEIPHTSLVVLAYADNRFEIFDKQKKEGTDSAQIDAGGEIAYYGKLGEFYVIANGTNGYLLNEKGRIIAEIPKFKGLSEDNLSVVVEGKDKIGKRVNLSIPFFSREMLLKRAKEVLASK